MRFLEHQGAKEVIHTLTRVHVCIAPSLERGLSEVVFSMARVWPGMGRASITCMAPPSSWVVMAATGSLPCCALPQLLKTYPCSEFQRYF